MTEAEKAAKLAEREDRCSELSAKAAEWIVDQLEGTWNTGWRGTDDLENAIYGWLVDHAIFRKSDTAAG
jgi:hypothetical protein